MAENEPEPQQDVRQLVRRDRGLPPRRDASAGSHSPTDPLSRRGFADGNGPAASTGDPDPESQQQLFSRLSSDSSVPAQLAVVRVGWAIARQAAAAFFTNVRGWWVGAFSPHRAGGPDSSPPCTIMFIALAGLELLLGTGTTTSPAPQVPSDDSFLAPAFVKALIAELTVDAVFGPILAALGTLVDRLGGPITDPARAPNGWTFLVRCRLLYRRGEGETNCLFIPAAGGLRAQMLCEYHNGQLGRYFGRANTGSLVHRLAFWVGQDVDAVEYVRSCQTCQRTKAEHCASGQRGLLHPLPLP